MHFVSPLLKHAVYPALHHSGWLNLITPPGGYGVVNYHGLVPSDHSPLDQFLDGNLVRPEVFRKQLQFLKAHYNVIQPEDFRTAMEAGTPLPSRAILLTCDDGLVNTLTDMLPVLRSEHVKCLFFVTGASCGENPGMLWYEELYQLMRIKPLREPDLQLPAAPDEPIPDPNNFQARWWSAVQRASRLDAKSRADWMARIRDYGVPVPDFHSEKRWRLLGLTELKQLVKEGMSIGAHTLTHPILSMCSGESARREIGQSKIDLELALNRPVWAFAYPFGNPATMGEREIRLARDAGFICAFLNVEYWPVGPRSAFTLPRIHTSLRTTLPEFAAHLSGFHARLQRAVGA
ncbi:MAG: polysaccharide deacetylase family protein [Candidatus Sulfotelmatobacter sp.]|jgi:peptidoglycan/xylan/chitin deacetylase (PgdA/CDA1 family)